MLREFIIRGGTDILLESDYSSYGNNIDISSFFTIEGIAAFSNPVWTYFFSKDCDSLKKEACGKWMYFYNDLEFAEKICLKAIKDGVCLESKHGNDKEGVCCFYINGDDRDAHKKVIQFFMDNDLIRKTADDKYYNIAFKFDSQTKAGEYGANFASDIKLEDFIDLKSGKWK
jgi:type I restriction enzyme R subunit